MESQSSDDERTLWVGNVDNKATEEILWELFLQAGPLETVKIPKDFKTGRQRNFAFIKFQHKISIPYTIELMNGICLFGCALKICTKNKPQNGHVPPQNERESTPKRRHQNFENEEQYQAALSHSMPPQNFSQFPGQGLMGPYPMPPHMMMAQYPMHAMPPHMGPHKHFHPRGGQIEEESFRKSSWDINGNERPPKIRREELPMRRNHSSPNRLHDEEHRIDRRRDPHSRRRR